MSSVQQANASRAYGAKPQGPTTPEGKAASSRNGLKHGLCSRTVALTDEDPVAWEAFGVYFHRQPNERSPAHNGPFGVCGRKAEFQSEPGTAQSPGGSNR